MLNNSDETIQNEMTLVETRRLKTQTEKEIEQLIRRFQEVTGCGIEGITFDSIESCYSPSKPKIKNVELKVVV